MLVVVAGKATGQLVQDRALGAVVAMAAVHEVLERIDWLYGQEVDKSLGKLPDLLVRRYARRMASRPPSAGAKIKDPDGFEVVVVGGHRVQATSAGPVSAAAVRR